MRTKTLVAGLILSVVAGLLVGLGGSLGLELSRFALFGSAAGATLGLVPLGRPEQRALGWLVGFLAAWLGYALRAGLLPDTAGGRAVAAVVVLVIVTVAAAAGGPWLPLWAGLLGVASLAGAYEVTFSNAPTAFTSDSLTALTTVALAAALGFLATTLVELLVLRERYTVPVVEIGPPAATAGSEA